MNLNKLTPGVGDSPFKPVGNRKLVRKPCDTSPYLITRFQVGQGASGVTETSAVIALGSPLSREEYGGNMVSVSLASGTLYANEATPLEEQTFIAIENQGVLGTSSLVSVIHLDDSTANGSTINEVGLFVDNPFLITREPPQFSNINPQVSDQLGGEGNGMVGVGESIVGTPEEEAPGYLLAAYRHITPIQKESYFSLMIRWKINFSIPRT